jgi:succinyl-diaminopimelate desuccinylase
VVPAGDGWRYDPYEAVEEGAYIYGRGTQDMKSGVAAFVQAVKEAKNFQGTLSLLLTSDEEGEAINGTVKVLEYLREHNMLPDVCVVAEPTCEEVFGDAIKVGRRGSINGYLTLKGKQGHAAYPEKAINPIHQIAKPLSEMAGVDLDNGDEAFAPSKFVITDIRSGMEVTNVTPNELKMMFNVRNNTNITQKKVTEFVARHMKGLDYELRLTQGSYPFQTDTDTKLVRKIDEAIEKVTGLKPKHSTAGGTSDARFIAPMGVDVIEFGVKNDTIHSVNERTTKQEVIKLYEVFKTLIDIWEK